MGYQLGKLCFSIESSGGGTPPALRVPSFPPFSTNEEKPNFLFIPRFINQELSTGIIYFYGRQISFADPAGGSLLGRLALSSSGKNILASLLQASDRYLPTPEPEPLQLCADSSVQATGITDGNRGKDARHAGSSELTFAKIPRQERDGRNPNGEIKCGHWDGMINKRSKASELKAQEIK